METRKERYAKYREQIRLMREEDFPKPASIEEREEAVTSSYAPGDSITYSDYPVEKRKGKSAPYETYLHHRRVYFWIKIGLLAIAIAGFVTWFVLLQGRQ